MESKRTTHLLHVDKLPEDSVQIPKYGKHVFDNLYYSASNNKLYQQYPKRIREIPLESAEHGKLPKVLVRSDKGQTIYISIKKLKKMLSEVDASESDEPLIMDPPPRAHAESEDDETDDGYISGKPKPKGKKTSKDYTTGKRIINTVSGPNMRSQTGVIVDANAALHNARRGRKGRIVVTVDDLKLK